MKIATSAYPISWHDNWDSYRDKIDTWVATAAENRADLCVFPEYAMNEISSIAGADVAADRAASLGFIADHFDQVLDIHQTCATRYDTTILMGSGPARLGGDMVNRCALVVPNVGSVCQDKQIMTRFEREEWFVSSGGPLQIFDTHLGRIGVLICYDSEFPMLGRALADVDILLVPSCTEAASGYWRVRIGSMARALENQCVTVMASLLSDDTRFYGVDEATGAGGVFCPPDTGFPPTGIMALGQMGRPGWVYADVGLDQIAHVRRDGVVLNRTHWDDQFPRCDQVTVCKLG